MHRHFVRCNCSSKDLINSCTEVSGARISYDISVATKDAKEMIKEGHSYLTLSVEVIIATHKELEAI